MKNLIIFLLCTLPLIGMAQDGNQTSKKRFTTKDKQYNDWSLYGFGGTALIQTGDLTSINNGVGNWDFGWDFQVGVEKAINHTFGIMFQYQMGRTKQQYVGNYYPDTKLIGATEYQTFTVLGDINLTSLFRRFDQTAPYRWSWHGYLGMGFIGYKAKSNALSGYGSGTPSSEMVVVTDTKAGLGSFYSSIASGVRFKISKRVDLEGKFVYVFTGDEEFDGSGDPIFQNVAGTDNVHVYSPADIEEQRHDNFMTFSLGLNVKLGKHADHLFWVNPYKQDIPQPEAAPPLCQNGDADQDGICDDWDKCLDTPAGARIDGSGCALDVDEDGIIDLYDKCVTVPGTSANQGCPDPVQVVQDLNDLRGIEFDLDKDVIRPQSKEYLDNAAAIILKFGQGKKFIVEGHTDARGSAAYNQDLSQRRMDNVVNYLVGKGVPRDQLIGVGMGKKDLLYPECDPASKCPESLNEANRRVVFKLAPDNKY